MLSKAMASGLHLQPLHRQVIEDLAGRHLPGVEIWAYGSRVNGQSHEGSDLDLVLRGPKLAEIPSSQLGDFQEALQESTLPFLVEARDWARLPERFHGEIQRNYAVLVSKEGRWHNVTLGDCAILVRDSITPSTCPDLPYIGLEHIGQGTLSLNGTGSARDVESTKTAFCAGDILFGKLRPYFRKVVRPRFDGICSTDIWVVRPKEGVDAGFLYYLLASSEFVRFAGQGAEGTRMPRAKWEQVSRFSAHLPPVSEQRAIARILGALDDKIELNRCMEKTLEETIQELFKSWFVNFDPVRTKKNGEDLNLRKVAGIFPKEVDCQTRKPVGWRTWSLAELATYSKVSVSPYRQPEVTFEHYSIPAHDAGRQSIIERGACIRSNKTLIPDRAVLVSKLNPSIPRVWVPDSSGEVTKIASTEFLVFVPKPGLGCGLLSAIFSDIRFRRSLQGLATGTSKSHQRASPADVLRLECVAGEPKVFAAFESFVGPLMKKQVLMRRKARTVTGLRDTLLPKLISGQIRLADAEKALEGVV